MRNQPLYILTEDLNFFYLLKSELDKYKIHFQILEFGSKIPEIPSIVLTTSNEHKKLGNKNRVNYLVYSKNLDFDKYFLHVVAAVRIGYKTYYSTLTFSIDPGKKLGLMVFLDDYYLDSYCCFENSYFFAIIQKYIDAFEEDNPTLMKLNFKLGRGVLDITYGLVKQIYGMFQNRKGLGVCLIDEFKSSQFRLSGNSFDKKFTKDEISALILAFRLGIDVRFENFVAIFEQLRMKKLFIRKTETEKSENHDEPLLSLEEVVEKILNRKLPLSNAIEIINANNV
ncbi:MAG: hypothetical protein KGD72_09790 [Candidatus Lokiarchaeota archaeon]|nr:hypothetical protein [Candidatus Lokiarchaeota archaeon]